MSSDADDRTQSIAVPTMSVLSDSRSIKSRLKLLSSLSGSKRSYHMHEGERGGVNDIQRRKEEVCGGWLRRSLLLTGRGV